MLAGHESCNEQVGREAVRQFILGNWRCFWGQNSQELNFAFLSEPSECHMEDLDIHGCWDLHEQLSLLASLRSWGLIAGAVEMKHSAYEEHQPRKSTSSYERQ